MNEQQTQDLRGEIKDDEQAIYLMDHPDSDEEIPTLDMSPYLAGQPGGRKAVAEHLREISMTVGFFYLNGHGIPQELINAVFAESRRFFSLPDSVKENDSVYHDGHPQVGLPELVY